MIKFASENMINELKSLWVECFEGDGAYCDFFFENYFSCENCVVSVNDNDEVEAAAYIFRGEVRVEGKVHSVVFLYAGATFKKVQKVRQMQCNMQFCRRLLQKQRYRHYRTQYLRELTFVMRKGRYGAGGVYARGAYKFR